MDSSIKRILQEHALINDSTPSIDIFDLNYFYSRIDSLLQAFPSGGNSSSFTHSFAVKANPLRGVLLAVKNRGLGAECASISEVFLALSLGFEASKVIYDSPCKTREDIRTALEFRVVMNLDNEWEMEMVNEALKEREDEDFDTDSVSIGLRINPIVGGGSIDILSTCTKASKFGLPLREDTEEQILSLYEKYKWLNGIHIHVGSQGVPLHKFVDATKKLMDFVHKVEDARGGKSIKTIDIGGGLSTSYILEDKEPEGFAYSLYKQELEKGVPELFDGKRRVITEFGRSLALKAGKTYSRVHYIKDWIPEIRPILQINVGVNQFVRETYLPEVWSHRITLLDSHGNSKSNKEEQIVAYDIAGPLCFQGDYLQSNVKLPKANQGDILVVHDTGAYCMSMYSRYNSIVPSVVYGIEVSGSGDLHIECFKEKETPEETLSIWGSKSPRKIFLKSKGC